MLRMNSIPEFPNIKNDPVIRKALWQLAVGLAALFLGGLALFYYFSEEIEHLTQIAATQFGFLGMVITIFFTDTVVTPFPPDIILVIIAKSDLKSNWPLYVGLLGFTSTLAGTFGGWIGRQLSQTTWGARVFARLEDKSRNLLDRLGFWGVVLGALTPIPFSITCWTAGFIRMRIRLIFLASLLRIPRYFVYYILITSSDLLSQRLPW